jgi:tight adherence protein B
MNNFYELAYVLFGNPLWWWGASLLWGTFLIFILIRFGVWWHWQKPYRNFAKSKSQNQFIYLLLALLIFGGTVCGAFFFWGPTAIIFPLAGLSMWLILKCLGTKQKQAQVRSQLPLFLRTLASTLSAGYSVPLALEFTVREVGDPLKSQLKEGLQLLTLKQPLPLVLQSWQQKIQVAEFKFVTDSLVLQSSMGGDLLVLCNNVAQLLEERSKLERDIKSFTAQGKMSGFLMALLWPLSLIMFAWLSPSHTQVLFQTDTGKILLGLSLALELMGFLCIWRLIKLKI